jgi:hypothetical protein
MPKVEMVKKEAIIEMKIGSQFLKDLQAVLLYLTSLRSAEDLKAIVEKAKNDADSMDDWEKAAYNMLVLVTSLEENARDNGLTVEVEIQEDGTIPPEFL